jgi:hypothetical protein
MVDKLDQNYLGHFCEWEGVEEGSSAFLDHPNPPFDLGNVLFCCRGVDVDSPHQRPELFKFIIHQDRGRP